VLASKLIVRYSLGYLSVRNSFARGGRLLWAYYVKIGPKMTNLLQNADFKQYSFVVPQP